MTLTIEKLMGMLSSAFIPNNATRGILAIDSRSCFCYSISKSTR